MHVDDPWNGLFTSARHSFECSLRAAALNRTERAVLSSRKHSAKGKKQHREIAHEKSRGDGGT
jgi:hypothetical protein